MERLKYLRKYFKLTQKEFAEKIGIKAASYLSIEKGRRNLTEKRIKIICSAFNVNEEWIKTGKGNIFNSEVKRDEEQTIINRIEKTNKELQEEIKDLKEEVKKLTAIILNNKLV